MVVVTSSTLAGANTEFTKDFDFAYGRALTAEGWQRITRKRTSKGRFSSYSGFGAAPVMQDITKDGELVVDTPYHYSYQIENNVWKGAFEIERAAFEDDDLGEVPDLIERLALEAAQHPGRLALGLLVANGNAFDNVTYFNAVRVLGESANINNTLALTGVTAANIQTDIGLLRARMALFQDDKGIPQNRSPSVFVIRPEMAQAFFQALNADQVLQVAPQVPQEMQTIFTRSGYTVIVSPLIAINTWYGFHVGSGMSYPLIYQERVVPHLEPLADITTERAVLRDRFLWSARGRYNAGYGDPRTAIKVG